MAISARKHPNPQLPHLTKHKPLLMLWRMEQQDSIFRALSDPTRRGIFEDLCRGEAAVKEVTARAGVSQPAVSQHLAALRGAGLVCERRQGRLVYYRVDPEGLRPLVDWVAHYRGFWLERLVQLEIVLQGMEK